MDYQPKLLHASLASILSVCLIALSDRARGNVFTALIFGAIVFFGMTCVIVWMIAYSNHYDTVIRYIESFVKLDPEQRSALAFHLPSMRLRASRGQVQQLFEDTRATGEHVRLFLVDSDSLHTSSQRAWNTAEKPRWAWEEIYDWLVRHNKVNPDSAAGSHSYEWRGTAYQSMILYWLDSSVPDLNAVDGFEAPSVYASEIPSPSLFDSPSGVFQGGSHSRGHENGQNRGGG